MAHWLTLLLHSTRDPGSIPALGDCVEFARSPRVCVGFLPYSKDVRVRFIGHAKLPLNVRGINRVNTWGLGDRA